MPDLWKLATGDFIKGLIVAVLTAALALLVEMLKSGGKIDLEAIGTAALLALAAYLLKNLGTDSKGEILGKFKVDK